MNYEQFKEIISEEAEVTENLFNQVIISGVQVDKREREEVCSFLSLKAKHLISPTITAIISSNNSSIIKKRISNIYGKIYFETNFINIVYYIITMLNTLTVRVYNKVRGIMDRI